MSDNTTNKDYLYEYKIYNKESHTPDIVTLDIKVAKELFNDLSKKNIKSYFSKEDIHMIYIYKFINNDKTTYI